jgi:hypothetical protein
VSADVEYYYFDDLSVTSGGGTSLPTVTVSATDPSAVEPSNNGTFTFTRSVVTSSPLTVNFTRSGTATHNTDYTDGGTSVIIPAGLPSATTNVTVIDDTAVESSETAIVTISSNSAYTIGTSNSATVTITDNDGGSTTLPNPWVSADIGAVGATGSVTHSSGTFTVNGSGVDVDSTADEFRYVYQSTSDGCTITARVASITNTNALAKAGVMVRETTAANAQNFFLYVTPSNGVGVTWRSTTGMSTSTPVYVSGQTAPKWLRITRVGDVFRAYHSNNGSSWTQIGNGQTVDMASTATAGLAVTSHNDGTLCTGTIDNVTVAP